jgi:hypothetical protein
MIELDQMYIVHHDNINQNLDVLIYLKIEINLIFLENNMFTLHGMFICMMT